ncbi:MAG: site-specific integrase, partial [Micrococcaceae bacterium]|nr:site-specific integrase [Micrococcaceae bacterium]
MSRPSPLRHSAARRSDIFDDHESVIQGQYLENDHPVPSFGDTSQWDLRALGWSPNTGRQTHAVNFHDYTGIWNLRAREISMAMLNPTHSALRSAGLFRNKVPAHPKTVRMKIDALRRFVDWLTSTTRGNDLQSLQQHDFDEFLTHLKQSTSPSTTRMCIAAIRELHEYSTVLTGGGMTFRPWGDATTLVVSGQKNRGELTTPVIPPEVWWPL